MAGDLPKTLDLRTACGETINRAMSRGIRAELARNKLAGNSVVVWENGKIVLIPPEQIVVPDDDLDVPSNPEDQPPPASASAPNSRVAPVNSDENERTP